MVKTGIFVNDSVNWLTRESDSRAQYIVSLDLEKETSQKLSLPDVHFTTSYTSTTLGTLRGCLSLLSRKVKFSDVWIMKEYGNENSWTKLLTVPHTVECGFSGYNRALYISENDKVLMECTELGINSLVVYDSINNTFKISKFQNNIRSEMVTQEVYVESLISPL
ncbi:F-box/kelch-repeat protein At3g23880-like [Vicia villosa]|uniref:F-box/kelch-repeat protein At3g23880-like n=1 Tax=Vicia villosa TaxID=3911 RepID=UPI00273A9D53|nr:F-box/kelch-repeat protein At3g23880-like [Vicia villosa]